MKVNVVTTVEFENWEKAYLKYLDYDFIQVRKWEMCEEEFDPNIFGTKIAKGFKAGYIAAEELHSWEDY